MDTKGTSPLLAILLVAAALSVGVAFCVGLGWLEPSRSGAAIVQPSDRSPAVPTFQLGEIVSVQSHPLMGSVFLYATTEVGANFERLMLAGDEEGPSELVKAHFISSAKPGTHVRILGIDADPEVSRKLGCRTIWIQIRVLSGETKGEAGWIDAACLTR